MFKLKLHWQVFIAMALGILFALILGEKSTVVTPLGTIFMRLLKMIIVPLIIFLSQAVLQVSVIAKPLVGWAPKPSGIIF